MLLLKSEKDPAAPFGRRPFIGVCFLINRTELNNRIIEITSSTYKNYFLNAGSVISSLEPQNTQSYTEALRHLGAANNGSARVYKKSVAGIAEVIETILPNPSMDLT